MKKQNACLALLICASALLAQSVQAESAKAAVSWNGHGQVFQVSVSEQEFLGSMDGVMYIESSTGKLDEAFMECTVKLIMHRDDAKIRGHGNCMITESSTDTVFADYQCTGEIGACKGKFTLTGGSGRFEGISGGSRLIVRSPLRHIIAGTGSIENIAVKNGILLLPSLSYQLPGGRK
ncbi:MAG: hypothetical protein ABJ308_07785 [Halieaceae bacterium]